MIEIFLMNDQPVTCPVCGARVQIFIEFQIGNLSSQLCKCPNLDCQIIFIEQEDEEFFE